RSPKKVRRLREAAAKSATVCADCFQPLAFNASITLVPRVVEHVPERTHPLGRRLRAYERTLVVPICLACWLAELDRREKSPLRGFPQRRRFESFPFRGWQEVRRHRCENCGRPMRIVRRRPSIAPLPLWRRCCCTDCLYRAKNDRANKRRRVHHEPQEC